MLKIGITGGCETETQQEYKKRHEMQRHGTYSTSGNSLKVNSSKVNSSISRRKKKSSYICVGTVKN